MVNLQAREEAERRAEGGARKLVERQREEEERRKLEEEERERQARELEELKKVGMRMISLRLMYLASTCYF